MPSVPGGRLALELDRMRRAAGDAVGFVEGWDRDAFLADRRTQQAVVLSLLAIGEAAARIMDRHPGFAARHPEVPWRGMRGMRNRIAHGYFEVDLGIVWDTVRAALPDLLEALAGLAEEAAREAGEADPGSGP